MNRKKKLWKSQRFTENPSLAAREASTVSAHVLGWLHPNPIRLFHNPLPGEAFTPVRTRGSAGTSSLHLPKLNAAKRQHDFVCTE